jgi:hypothetical protein
VRRRLGAVIWPCSTLRKRRIRPEFAPDEDRIFRTVHGFRYDNPGLLLHGQRREHRDSEVSDDRIDAAPPAIGITAPADGSSIKRGTKVAVTSSATDNGTGAGAPSGIARVGFYVDGKKVASTTALPYAFT